jgi:hypothetical protein
LSGSRVQLGQDALDISRQRRVPAGDVAGGERRGHLGGKGRGRSEGVAALVGRQGSGEHSQDRGYIRADRGLGGDTYGHSGEASKECELHLYLTRLAK